VSSFINVNGKILPADEAGIRVDNRAFRYGYGLFETMLVKDNLIRLGAYHWDRLFDGMALLLIHAPKYFREELEREVVRTVHRNKMEALCRVRLQVYAGNGGLYDGDQFNAKYVIEVFAIEPTVLEINEAGLTVGIADSVKHTGKYANIKTNAALHYALASRQAKNELWNDALLLNEKGNIVESTLANIFWIQEGKIFTPPLSEGCVAGVMRKHLLVQLPLIGYDVEETSFELSILGKANEIFITNAVRGVRWVKNVDNIHYVLSQTNEIHAKVVVSLHKY
jgi:branched-chain amino acid aminotransferase